MTDFKRSWLVLLPLFLCGSLAWAQLYSGSVTGVVSDPSNAVIPGAQVVLQDQDKGLTTTVNTDNTGRFLFRNVSPARYRITVTAAGFQSQARSDVRVDVSQNIAVDFALSLTVSSDVMNVTGEATMLATEDAATGQVVGRKLIDAMPMMDRDAMSLAYLTPGLVSAYNGKSGSRDQGNNFVASGSRNATADVLLDGASTTNYEQNGGIQVISYTPSPDAVEEFKVQTSNFSAEFGFSGATVVNMVTRSGSNEYHGTAYDYLRNQKLDANDFFKNRDGQGLPGLRRNNYGGTFGGPIIKNKTFFFFDVDGLRSSSAQNANFGVPSVAERGGDFSEICGYNGGTFDASGRCSVAAGQLWDPYTSSYDPNQGAVRSSYIPFNNLANYMSPGNPKLNGTGQQLAARPGNLIDPVAAKMMQYFPLPNRNVGTANYQYYNNWSGSGATTDSRDQWDLKIDHRLDDKTNLSGKFSRNTNFRHMWNCFGNVADPCTAGPTDGSAYLGALNGTHVFSPTVLLAVSYGFNRTSVLESGGMGDAKGIDPVKLLGLPDYMYRSGMPTVPSAFIGDSYSSANGTTIGTWPWTYIKGGSDAHQLLGTLSWVKGTHELKFGAEGRLRRINYIIPGPTGGYFGFDRSSTSQISWDYETGGDAMASFLTGLGNWGGYEVMQPTSTQSFQWGGFIQDNWKVNRTLTVNLGLRYDLTMPRTERFNRQNWVDLNVVSPLQVPELGTLHGGEIFASSGQRTNYDASYTNFQPRIGFAWQPVQKTVIRGGYGIFYSVSQSGAAGKGGTGQQGFTKDTNLMTSYLNDGATPWGRLSDPWPGVGPDLPPGNSLGLLNDVGYDAIGPVRNVNSIPYEQSWSFGLQREMQGGILLNANYVGKKGTHLYFGGSGNYNVLGSAIEGYSAAQIADLQTYVPNPFYGVITDPNTGWSSPTIQKYHLMTPYPQFSTIGGDPLPAASSMYHGLQLSAEKRLSNGIQFLVTYSLSKSIDDASSTSGNVTWLGGGTSLQDPNKRWMERSLSLFDITHVFQISHVWELPFGHGRKIGAHWNALVDGVLGGWQMNGIWTFDSGRPLTMGLQGGRSLPTYGSQRPDIVAVPKRNNGSDWLDHYFANPEAFAAPAPYAIGNASRTIPWIRMPGQANTNLALVKDFALSRVREGMKLQYRVEALNALNHVQFSGPNTTVGSDRFGEISSQANSPREVQMALKLLF